MLLWSEWWIYLTGVAISLLALLYYKLKKNCRYFEDRNIPYIKCKYFLGSDPDGTLLRLNVAKSWDNIYKQLGENKVGGFFQLTRPFLMIKDPEFIKTVLISSFDHFMDRPFLIDEKTNPLDAHLFFLRGKKWRFVRSKLSPIFSSGKLKWMFQEMEKCGDVFIKQIDKLADGKDYNIYDELANYSSVVIGSCAFGIEPEILQKPDCELRKIGRDFMDCSRLNSAETMFLLRFSMPRLINWLKLPTTPRYIANFFISTTRNMLEKRRNTGKLRKDFVQLLMQLKEKGVVEIDLNEEDEDETGIVSTTDKFEITDLLLSAQTFVFYIAGFETTSRTLDFLLHLLSQHQDIQDKAREEVIKVKAKHGHFTFEALKEMTYVDNCISETLRLYPPVAIMLRECVKDFTLPDGTFIEKGTSIVVPNFSVQRDPKYYPEPTKFNPDRFENKPATGTYLPFGDGPRYCIGKRFGLTEIKIVVAKLLERYRFDPSPLNKYGESIDLKPRSSISCPKNGLYIQINKL